MRLWPGRLWASGIVMVMLAVGTAQADVSIKPYGTISGKDSFFISMNFRQLPVHIGGRTVAGSILLQNNPDKVPDGSHLTQADYAFPHVEVYPHQWPGIYFETAFEGTALYAKFDDSANIYNLYIDDQPAIRINKPGNVEYRVDSLSPALHRVRLEKLTEAQASAENFEGFFISPNEKTASSLSDHTRQIEFIGDSYTVGYGNTAGKRQCTKDEIWATTDTAQAFGPLTAKHYNADYQINAYSGRGMVRNYDGFAGDTLPGLYPYTLFDGKTAYSDPTWSPQVIVIALGTNDFSTPVHAGEKWKTQDDLVADYEATYVSFVKSLRAKHPNAAFVLISYDPATSPAISTVRDRLKTDGDSKVDFLEITEFTKNACDYHPDTSDDRKISNALISYIDGRPDLWPQTGQSK